MRPQSSVCWRPEAVRRSRHSPNLTAISAHGRPGAQLISLNATVRHLEHALARVAAPSVKLERRLYDDLDPILADPAGIERMVLALARSSREAMPKGGTLTLETDRVFLDKDSVSHWPGMSAGRYSMLLVSDTRPARRDSKPQLDDRSADMDEARI